MKTLKTQKGTELPLTNLQGKDYLQVAYRLVWFREEKTDWSIVTEYLFQDEKSALAKATILDANGRVIATGHKEESKVDFPRGHREKAETGAIGRALALCGYGTQFEPELDEGDRIVDSPLTGMNAKPWMEQPQPGDGQHDNTYKVMFGKFRGRTLEEIGAQDLKNYVNYLEDKAKKDGKELVGIVAEFIKMADEYIGAFENNSPVMAGFEERGVIAHLAQQHGWKMTDVSDLITQLFGVDKVELLTVGQAAEIADTIEAKKPSEVLTLK